MGMPENLEGIVDPVVWNGLNKSGYFYRQMEDDLENYLVERKAKIDRGEITDCHTTDISKTTHPHWGK